MHYFGGLSVDAHVFSKKEEMAHAITHGIGALLSVIALIFLISYASINGDILTIVSVIVFGCTMLLMYLSSTIVHSLPVGKCKDVFLIIDHTSIYFFIAGTYTPLLLISIEGTIGWTLFGIVWGIAFIGSILKVFFVKRFIVLSTLTYILMGWLIVIVWRPLSEAMHQNGLILLILGGFFYTTGAFFYIWKKIPYHHVIWHVFVMLGSAFHFFTILYYVIQST